MGTKAKERSGILRSAVFDGDRQLRRASFRFAEEFRALRLRAGLSQAAIGRAIGVDRSVICRLELADERISPEIRARAAAVVGAEFRMSLYPTRGALIQDEAQARSIEMILRLRHDRWRAIVEAPVPGPGRRSTDLRLECGRDIVLIESESRVAKLEEMIRECHDKRDAVTAALPSAAVVHVLLALPATRHHRAFLRDHPSTVKAAFPFSSADIEPVLMGPTGAWPGDGILWVRPQ